MTDKNIGLYDYNFHLVPPEEKTEQWAIEYLQSRYPLWTTYFNSSWWNGRTDFNLLRLYGEGRQPETLYYKDFYPDGYMQSTAAGGAGNDWLGMRWNINSPVPNFINNIIAKVEANTYPEIECEATDDLVQNKKEEKKLLLKFQKILDDDLKEISAKMKLRQPMKSNIAKGKTDMASADAMSALKDIEFDMSNDVELQMYMDIYYREAVEIANELCINTLFQLNDYPQIMREVRQDALYYGLAATRQFMDNNTCMPKIEWLRLENVVMSWGRRQDYKDSEGWAYNELMTLNQVIGKFGKELTPDMCREIFTHGVTNYGYWNGSFYDTSWKWTWDKLTKADYDRVRVKVAYFEFKSQNYETTEVSSGKYGSKKIKKKQSGYKTEKEGASVQQDWAQVVYKGYYVVGMNKIFQYGMLENMVRDEGNEQITQYSISVNRFAAKSFVEHCIPHADGIQLAYLKFQLELRQSVPSGWAFNIDQLAEIQLGDGKKMNQLEVMRLFSQTGKLAFKSMDEDGNPLPMAQNGQVPIINLPNGVSAAVEGYVNAINFHLSQIERLTGYHPQVMEGQPLAPRTTQLATQLAQQGSESTVDYLIKGCNTMIENTARYIGQLVLDMATYGGDGWESLKRMVGNVNTSVIESMDKIAMHKFGIFIKEKMSDEEMMQFKQFVMDAYQKGQIDLSDVLMVWFLKDYKQAVALFNIKRSKQMAQQAQMAQQQFQLQQQQMQAQMALTAQLKQMEYQTAMRNTDVKAQSLIASEQEKNRGKIAAAQVDGFNKHKNTAMQGDIDAFLERQRNLQPNSSQ